MSGKRLTVRKVKEILRLRYERGLGLREIGQTVGKSPSVVQDCLARFRSSGLQWPLPADLSESSLDGALYPSAREGFLRSEKVKPDFGQVHRELSRKHVTLRLLWQEYLQMHGERAYGYSWYCEQYDVWSKPLKATLRGSHKAGHKTFIDWSGDGVPIVNRETGEVWEAPLFLACLGASGLAFVKAAQNRKLAQWLQMHDDAFAYFQGVTELVIPDNEKTGVTSPCYYDPDVNVQYAAWAAHYETAVKPTRPYSPKDKALVENAVLNAQRWILASLRNHTFFTVAEANAEIARLLEVYNDRPMQQTKMSRRELYESIERAALKPLPASRFEMFDWAKVRVHMDHHVVVDKHHYSAPYRLIGQQLEAHWTGTTVELIHNGKRVALHPRSYVPHGTTTDESHRPGKHIEYLKWNPERIIGWAEKSGEHTAALAQAIMASKRHPEQGYRACLGVMRLGKRYGDDRLEAACGRALALRSPSYRTVESILRNGADLVPSPGEDSKTNNEQLMLPRHANIRGANYYQ
jgi:transposase